MSEAFTNVVSDAIMVIQARREPLYGSQDFVTLMFLCWGIGGVIGCVYGGVMTEYSHPKWCFFTYSFLGIIVSAFACCLTKRSEQDRVKGESLSEEAISTSQESYEFRVRRERMRDGATLEQARA